MEFAYETDCGTQPPSKEHEDLEETDKSAGYKHTADAMVVDQHIEANVGATNLDKFIILKQSTVGDFPLTEEDMIVHFPCGN